MRLLAALAVFVFSVAGPASAADAPLADGHIHYSKPDWSVYTPDQIVDILDKAGMRRALVSSTPDDGTLKLYDRDPKRFVPMLRPYRTRDDMGTWWRDPAILPYLEQRLAKGVHRGIGEFHINGKDIRTPVLQRITEIAVQRNLYLQAHSDEAAVIELFAIEPKSKIIWAHAGMSSSAAAVGALMDKQPNLWADLSYRYGGDGSRSSPWPPRPAASSNSSRPTSRTRSLRRISSGSFRSFHGQGRGGALAGPH